MKRFFKWIYNLIKILANDLFFSPLRNGNGVVLNTEFASYTTVWVVFFSIIIEGLKEGQQYTDVQFIAILGLLAGVLGIKEYFNKNKKE